MDEKFTHIADSITEFVGRWYFSAISLIVLLVWTVYGIIHIPGWFTSPDWNFPANSVTTLGEWFLAAFTLAAANRVERRTHDLLEEIRQHAKADLHTTERVERKVTGEE